MLAEEHGLVRNVMELAWYLQMSAEKKAHSVVLQYIKVEAISVSVSINFSAIVFSNFSLCDSCWFSGDIAGQNS